jgi:hypothetical protein
MKVRALGERDSHLARSAAVSSLNFMGISLVLTDHDEGPASV